MTKAELLTILANDFHRIGEPVRQLSRGLSDLFVYTVPVYTLDGDDMQEQTAGFIVEFEGDPVNEKAYWHPQQIGVAPAAVQFAIDLNAYITATVIFKQVSITDRDDANETALAWCIVTEASLEVERKVRFFRGGDTKIAHAFVDTVVKTGG